MFIKQYFLLLLAGIAACASCQKSNGDKGNNTDDTGNTTGLNATVSTVAGTKGITGTADGSGAAARFSGPEKMVWDGRNQCLYIVDDPVTIRKMDAQNNVTTYLNAGGGVINVFNDITDISLAPGAAGSLYVITARALYRIEPAGNSATVIPLINNGPGNQVGPFSQAQVEVGSGVALGKDSRILFFNGAWNTLHIAALTGATAGTVTALAGKPLATSQGPSWPFQDGQGEAATFGGRVDDIAADGNGNIYVADYVNNVIRKVTPEGAVSSMFQRSSDFQGSDINGAVNSATANRVHNVAASLNGTYIFFTSYGSVSAYNSNPALRLVRPEKDVIAIAGNNTGYKDGPGKEAAFGGMDGIAVTDDGKTIYIAEYSNKIIRKVVLN